MAYFTKKVDPSLAKPLLNFNGGLAKLGLAPLVKQAPGVHWTLCLRVRTHSITHTREKNLNLIVDYRKSL